MVLLIARWGAWRVPMILAPIDPQCRGPQNSLFRPMVQDVVPPAWVRQLVGVADAGVAANATRRLSHEQTDASGLALPRTRQFTHGNHRRDVVQHLPQNWYDRRATAKAAGRRQAYWGFVRDATWHHLGDVTIVLSKKRRNAGPTHVKIIVTKLTAATAGMMLSIDARRWGGR
jgi:hypothetical protein